MVSFAIFVSPKNYVIFSDQDEEIVKCKGVKNLGVEAFESLGKGDNVTVVNESVFKRKLNNVEIMD